MLYRHKQKIIAETCWVLVYFSLIPPLSTTPKRQRINRTDEITSKLKYLRFPKRDQNDDFLVTWTKPSRKWILGRRQRRCLWWKLFDGDDINYISAMYSISQNSERPASFIKRCSFVHPTPDSHPLPSPSIWLIEQLRSTHASRTTAERGSLFQRTVSTTMSFCSRRWWSLFNSLPDWLTSYSILIAAWYRLMMTIFLQLITEPN